jgi:glycerophosphoryl diester phosphodiesterase
VLILAHRGACRVFRENTVEAFCEARRLGADGVELDVRRSADGALVVHHDATVAGFGPIASLRVSDLPSYVPLLDSAIEACRDLMVNVELKDLPGEPAYDVGYPLARLVARYVAADRALAARVIVSSFDLQALDAAVGVEPSLVTGWLTPSWFDQADALGTVVERGHRGLHPQHEAVTEELVATAHEAGVRVTAWTVDDPLRMRQLADAGVDSVITNVPDGARSALSARP